MVGDLTLGFEAFTPMGDLGQTLGLYTVEPGSPSEHAPRMLASWPADNARIPPIKPPGARTDANPTADPPLGSSIRCNDCFAFTYRPCAAKNCPLACEASTGQV